MLISALLGIINEAGRAVLVLTDGVEEPEFRRSRLTRAEVRRHIRNISDAIAGLPPEVRGRLQQLDFDGWIAIGRRVQGHGPAADEALWFAARSMVPATLMWLDSYRKNHPDLFAFKL